MKKLIVNSLTILTLSLFIACGDKEEDQQNNDSTDIPECLEDMLQTEDANINKVWSYEWNDGVYYFLQSGCCDFFDELWDDDCQYICSPSGGLAGTGDGQCPKFFEEACCEKLLWEL